jgi:hypothetical protein
MCIDASAEVGVSILVCGLLWYQWTLSSEVDIYNIFLSFPSVF